MRIFAPLTLLGYLLASAVPATPVQIPHGQLTNPFQAYLNAPALYNADTVGAPEDWWREAEAKGYKLRLWVDQELANSRKIAGDGIDQIKAHAKEVISTAKRVGALVAHGDKQEIHDELSRAVEDTLKRMEDTFPPPEDAMGHEARKESVHRALEMAQEKIVDALKGRVGVDEVVLRQDVSKLCFTLAETTVIAGDLVEQHPVLVETIVIIGSIILGALIPEWFILRPIIRVLGWGPLGPVKGTPAAWAQRYFWGAAVTEGSWYAALQSAGMNGVGWLTRTIGALVGGLVGAGSAWSSFGGH